jgi:hypothetical protein
VLQDPAHNPYFTPLEYYPFGSLKRHLSGQRFVNDDVIVVVMAWLQALDQDFFAEGFSALVSHWDKCLNRGDNCVEK